MRIASNSVHGCILTHVVYQGRPSLTFREEGERLSGLVD